jgi:hypothetical protein
LASDPTGLGSRYRSGNAISVIISTASAYCHFDIDLVLLFHCFKGR